MSFIEQPDQQQPILSPAETQCISTDSKEQGNNLSEREEMEAQLIKALITSYFNIVRKSIQDIVPKTIMHLLINCTRENLQNRLISELYKQDAFEDLLVEDENIVAERDKCKTMLEIYRKAFSIINEAI
ncbi:Dynamin- GTPase protein [Basidiobolus ranarum]|uniref:Dynamin- GTPase protein n=1 Tax=Basidiobolus ranarum TaxID=34480 RepID=A0ABR2VLD3_9FUNG